MTSHLHETERAALAALFFELGPNAPTLNEGWQTKDLASHLYIREHHPLAAAGMFLKPFAGQLEKRTRKLEAEFSYEEIVKKWGTPPPKYSIFHVLGEQINTAEHFIHHEDVRRGGGEIVPRDFSREERETLAGLIGRFAAMGMRGVEARVLFQPTDVASDPIAAGNKKADTPPVTVRGEAGELLLWASGRDAVEVEISGDGQALQRSGF